jgi:hypothetical protein
MRTQLEQSEVDPLHSSIEPEGIFRLFFGSILLLGGTGLFCWIIMTSLDLLHGTQDIPVMKMIPGLKDGMIFQAPNGPISIPADAFVLVSYALVIMILSLLIGVGSAFLKAGSHLLQPEIRRTLRQILRKVKRLSD